MLDRLDQELCPDLRIFYLRGADTSRGWGVVAVSHRSVVLDRARSWKALCSVLLSDELNAICLFGYRGVARVAAALVARCRGIPLVLRGDSNVRDELSRPWLRRLAKRYYLRMLLGQPEIWTIGAANAAYWKLLGFRRRELIPYGVPRLPGGEAMAAALRSSIGRHGLFVYAYVGRLVPEKGITDLLDAYDMVSKSTAAGDTGLLIVGSGELEPQVRAFASTRDDCIYLGAVPYDQLGAVYEAADVVVVPSRREPWGLVVNEALGFGTRIIATESVAAADDLCTEERGRRCPSHNPAALAAAMLAEYNRGDQRAARLPCLDVSSAMAERLRQLTAVQVPASAQVAAGGRGA